MECRRCLENGMRRNGGTLGVCHMHAKVRCAHCGAKTLGPRLCITCAHRVDIERWKARANLRVITPDQQFDHDGLRREKLLQAKFYFHESVEVLFQGFLRVLETLWGDTTQHEGIMPPPRGDSDKKAA